MIMRRFSKPGDVERARKYVLQVRLIPNIAAVLLLSLKFIVLEVECVKYLLSSMQCTMPS